MAASPFSFPNYRWLWGSSLCAYCSMWIQAATISWLAYDITGSTTVVGAILAVRVIPLLSLAPLSGVAADRYDRRKLLQYAQWLSAATVMVFGLLLAFDRVSTWMLFAFTIILGAGNVIDRPSRHSTVFDLVPREIVPKAVALNIMGNSSMRVLGPAIAGLLIAAIGAAGNFFIQGALYLASGLLVYLVAFPPRKPAPGRVSAWSELKEGLRYVAGDRTTRLLMTITSIQYFLLVPVFNTLFPVYAKDIYKVGPEGLGLMFTMVGVGGVIGAGTASVLMRFDRIGLIRGRFEYLRDVALDDDQRMSFGHRMQIVNNVGQVILHDLGQITAKDAIIHHPGSCSLADIARELFNFLAGTLNVLDMENIAIQLNSQVLVPFHQHFTHIPHGGFIMARLLLEKFLGFTHGDDPVDLQSQQNT